MKMIAVVVVALAMAACDDDDHRNSRATTIAFSPIPETASVQIFPQTLPVFGVTSPCASGMITTGLDLVIVQTGLVNLFMDQVTLRLIDGTNLGPAIMFSRPQLNTMFGSTLVAGSRRFSFRPQFDCRLTRPRSIGGEVVLVDANGGARSVSVNAEFK